MAASPGAEEDSVYDTARLSLFDLILERTRAQNKVRKRNIQKTLLLPCFHSLLLENIKAIFLEEFPRQTFFFAKFCR